MPESRGQREVKGSQELPESALEIIPSRLPGFARRQLSGILALVVVIAALAIIFALGNQVMIRYAFTASITLVLGISWNMIGGLGGQHSFAHPCFFGAGAYVGGILLQDYPTMPLSFAVLAGGLTASVIALLLSPALRVRGAYFAILTVTVSEGAALLAVAYFPGGSSGLYLPINASPSNNASLMYGALLVILLIVAHQMLQSGKVGIGLRMIRDDEDAAASVGVPIRRLKTLAFVLGAPFVGAMGVVYAANATYVGPSDVFGLTLAITAMLACLIGGVGWLWGALIGGVIWQMITQYSTGITGHVGTSTILDGAVLLGVVLLMPKGVVGVGVSLWKRLRDGRSLDKRSSPKFDFLSRQESGDP